VLVSDVNYVLGWLRYVGVGSVADILEVHAQTHAAYMYVCMCKGWA
jgi:hypothetical protein